MRAIVFSLLVMFTTVTVSAGTIYRWTGSDGRVHYGDQPPPGARSVQLVGGRTGAPLEGVAAETGEAAARRKKDCDVRRSQLELYSKATKLTEKDSLGRERTYTDEERNLLLARTQAEVNVLCAQAPPEETPESSAEESSGEDEATNEDAGSEGE